jgi:hypothetical protein
MGWLGRTTASSSASCAKIRKSQVAAQQRASQENIVAEAERDEGNA